MTTEQILTHDDDHARQRGSVDGTNNAIGTIEIDPMSCQDAITWITHYENGELGDHYALPEPLSGQWAGESLIELGMGDWDDEMLNQYEDAYLEAWLDTYLAHARNVIEAAA